MKMNSQKLLPLSKTSSIILGSVGSTSKNKKNSNDGIKRELLLIREKLVKIDSIVKETFSLQKENDKNLKIRTENKRFLEKETKLEDKKQQKESKIKGDVIPQMGILDRVNRFITFTLLGFLVNKFFKYLPDILEFTKKIGPVVNFIESFVGDVFKGFVNFIDLGYKTYDKVRDFTKTIGGENFQKTFDDFNKSLNTFVNLAIIAGMATMGGTDFGLGKKGGRSLPGTVGKSVGRSGIGEYLSRNKQTKFIERKYGNNAARLYELRRSQGVSQTRALADVRKRFDHLKFQGGLKGGIGSGKVFGRGFKNAGSRFTTKLIGKAGKRLAGKVFGKIPIIGGLVDFIFALWSGEPVGRAAAKGVGSTIGSALGTFVPIPFAGIVLGGILGDIIGGALYDTLVNKKPDEKKPSKKIQARKNGGKISTRKGKTFGGAISRTIRTTIISPKPIKVIPGSDVGGKKSIQKIFPEPTGTNTGKTVNPLGFLTNTTNSMGEIPFLGPVFSLFGKILLGDFPDKSDYRTIGIGINAWINNAISKGHLQGNLMKGFADGGIIDNDMMKNISGWVEKSVEELVKNKVTQAINDLRRNLGMELLQETISGKDVTDEGGELGSASDAVGGAKLFINAGFPPLAASILSGNIQQESGWKGQRTPWVLNDGAGTNKGLISWNRSRIVNAEKFLGKPLETASNSEQVKWIKEELKQYGLLDIFLNPNSTEKQLQDASYKYIGWGDLGDRWKFSKQIFAAIQKGETGTYAPPTTTTGVTSTGYKPQRPGLFNAIQYITGDRSYRSNYRSDHGGDVYHEHIGFSDTNQRNKAMTSLRNKGFTIGSIKTGEHASGSLHYSNQAFDVPFYPNQSNLGYTDNKVGEEKFSKDVRGVLGLQGGGLISEQKSNRNIKSIQSYASYDDMDMMIFIQPVIITKYTSVPSSNASISFGMGGGVNTNSKVQNLFAR